MPCRPKYSHHMQLLPFYLLTSLALLAALLANRRALNRLRRSIARDLHDDLGASLSNINLLSGLVELELDKGHSEQATHYLRRIREEASRVHEAVGDSVRLLGPDYRQLGQLAALINRHGQELLEEKGTRFVTRLPDSLASRRLPARLRRDLYLLLKEAVHNIMRHAGARRAALHFWTESGYLYCALIDDGRGFSAPQARQGNGLTNMRRRAALMGAELSLRSSPGQGSSLLLRLPLRFRLFPWLRPRLSDIHDRFCAQAGERQRLRLSAPRPVPAFGQRAAAQ